MKIVSRVAVLLLIVAGLLACSTEAFAQGRGGAGGRGGPGGRGGGFGGQDQTGLSLLTDENVRKELELVDEQVEKLRTIAESLQTAVRESFQGVDFGSFQDLSQEERQARMAEMQAKTQEVVKTFQKDIDEVLLPHQRDRLKQIVVQSQIRRQGAEGALSSGALAETLGITEEQKTALREKATQVQADLQEQIEKLRQEAQNDLLSVLTPEQQAKLKSLMGNPITFAQGGPGGGFGGGGFGGQPGGPGGRGGQGGRGGRGGNAPDAD